MEAKINIGSTTSFELREALLVYRTDRGQSNDPGSAFITRHAVHLDGGRPALGAGAALAESDLVSLVESLQGSLGVEFLPPNVLARTASTIVWWVPPSIRPMFYSANRDKEVSCLTGHRFPQPGLVFRAQGRALTVRALAGDKRPEGDTPLSRAPYWNVNNEGLVCLGSARVPREVSVASLVGWESGFFESEFTHPNSSQSLVRHPEGFVGLWKSLIEGPLFRKSTWWRREKRSSHSSTPRTAVPPKGVSQPFHRGSSMKISHELTSNIAGRRPLRVLLIGCGGNGSALLFGLPYLHHALVAWGRADGLDVTVIDGDTVSPTNCVRQPFGTADIGQNKATLLVNRVNLFHALGWKSEGAFFTNETQQARQLRDSTIDLFISCVDTRAARRQIHDALNTREGNWGKVRYWLDLGNGASSGQFVLGQPENALNTRSKMRLRTVTELFPSIMDTSEGEGSLPSCSAAEALDRQEPFINNVLATSALAMVTRLFRYGSLDHHGAFYNAASGRTVPMPIDPKMWEQSRRHRQAAQRAPRLPAPTTTARENKSHARGTVLDAE